MRDPWHEETLGQLVLLIRSRAPVRFAVVITSSEELEEEVVESLKAEHAEAIWHFLELDGHGDLEAFKAWRRLEPDPRRVVLVRGLSQLVAEEADTKILGAFNYQREAIAERKEGLIFFVDEEAAATLMSEAPDFYRFTIGFDFLCLRDLISVAERRESKWVSQRFDAVPLSYYQKKLDRARAGARPDQIVVALLDIAHHELSKRMIVEACKHLEEVARLVEEIDDPVIQMEVLEERARALIFLDRHEESIALARAAMQKGCEETVPQHVLHRTRLILARGLRAQGQYADALATLEPSISDVDRLDPLWAAALLLDRALILADVGRKREAYAALEGYESAGAPDQARGLYCFVRAMAGLRFGMPPAGIAKNLGRALAHLGKTSPAELQASSLLRCHGEIRYAREMLGETPLSSIEDAGYRHGLATLLSETDLDLLDLGVNENRARIEGWLALARQNAEFSTRCRAEITYGELQGFLGQLSAVIESIERTSGLLRVASHIHLSEAEHVLARLYRLDGDLDRAAELAEGAARRSHEQGARPIAARADTERAFVALARGDAESAREHADAALRNIAETRFRRDEPAALAARAEALRRLGEDHEPDEKRWRRLVRGMGAKGLEQRIEQSLEAT